MDTLERNGQAEIFPAFEEGEISNNLLIIYNAFAFPIR